MYGKSLVGCSCILFVIEPDVQSERGRRQAGSPVMGREAYGGGGE